eukprot:1677205-Pyramimonas_sp.AAC.1
MAQWRPCGPRPGQQLLSSLNGVLTLPSRFTIVRQRTNGSRGSGGRTGVILPQPTVVVAFTVRLVFPMHRVQQWLQLQMASLLTHMAL